MDNNITFPTFTINLRGEARTFTSAFATLADAWKALDAAPHKSDFTHSLLLAARERRCSKRQISWIHWLATEGVAPFTEQPGNRQSPTPVAAASPMPAASVDGAAPSLLASPDLSPILDLLDRAFEAGKKFPQLTVPAPTRTGRLVIKRSRDGGAVLITGEPFGTAGSFLGRITRLANNIGGLGVDGIAVLRALAADPQAVCAQHGVATGTCCYCGRPLSTKESRSVGYGPICADKFGLPWGEVSAEVDAADAAAKDPFKGLGFDAADRREPQAASTQRIFGNPEVDRSDRDDRYYPYSGYGPRRGD